MSWGRGILVAPPQDPSPSVPTSDAIERAVDVVFRDPELQAGLQPPSVLQLMRAVVDAVLSWFQQAVDSLFRLGVEAPGVFWLIMIVLVAVLGLLVWHIVYTVRQAFRAPVSTLQARPEAAEDRVLHSAELRAQARRLASAGDLREAARMLLLALLALLDERRILHVARGWTNREILHRLETRGGEATDLEAFGTALERSSYGGAELARPEYDRLEASLQRLGPLLSRVAR